MILFNNFRLNRTAESNTALKRRSYSDELISNETLFQHWVNHEFRVANKEKEEICKNILRSREGKSQYGQDMTVFFTLFQRWAIEGRQGFYVDSGANDAVTISNTVFFDWCLGWKGLCVEPNPQYHANIRKYRSCTLLPECISDRDHQVPFQFHGVHSYVDLSSPSNSNNSTSTVKCSTLESMLQRANVTDNTIDFWSLDVEGYEMTVLNTVDFKKIHVGALLIEDFWIPSRELDQLMYDSDFIKLYELPLDALYVNRSLLIESIMSNKVWLPPSYRQIFAINLAHRAKNKDKLKCF